MPTTDVPDTDFHSNAADTVQGFGAAAPADPFAKPAAPAATAPAKPALAAPANPATPKVEDAKPATPKVEDAKPTDGSLLGKKEDPAPVYDLKSEGMHADDLKTFAIVLGENKIDPKAGQALLDKFQPVLKARAEANLAAAQTGWRAENAKDAAAAARVEAALSVVSPEAREALRSEVYVDHPALFRFVAEMGAFVQKATKQETTVTGEPPVSAPKFNPSDTSAAAFAGGVSSGF